MTDRSTSRLVFKVELVLITLPLSLLCAVALALGLFDAVATPSWSTIFLALLVSLAAAAMVAGWVLSIRYLRVGGSALDRSHWGWWASCSLGVAVAGAALFSTLFRPSEPQTPMWYFRNDLSPLALGLALLIPLGHLLVERFRSGR